MTLQAPRSSDLNHWLLWLEQLHHKQIDLTLERVKQVAERLAVTECIAKVFMIGGTNGKGSCIATLETIYLLGGYKVGAYTSPHLLQFNERIRLNGQSVGDQDLILAFQQIEQARGEISLTFFEFTTLAALLLFKQAKLDVILLEVGLGGRFDAVNIVDADVSIITSVDLDHTDWLGDTREKIAAEKAPIYRPQRYAICGDPNPPQSLCDYAHRIDARFLCQGKDFYYQQHNQDWDWLTHSVHLKRLPLPHLLMQNISTALMAYCCLAEFLPVAEQAIYQAIAEVRVTGRFQQISHDPLVIVDVAHNPAAAKILAQRLQTNYADKTILAVFSAVNDKDVAQIVAPFKNQINNWYIAPLPTPRSHTIDELTDILVENGIQKIEKFANIAAAYQQAILHSSPEHCIIVFGSFYTVAAVLG